MGWGDIQHQDSMHYALVSDCYEWNWGIRQQVKRLEDCSQYLVIITSNVTKLRLMRDTHALTHTSRCILNSISCFWSVDLLHTLRWMGCLSSGVTRTDVDLIIKMSADGWMPLTIKTDNTCTFITWHCQGQGTSPLSLSSSLPLLSLSLSRPQGPYYVYTHSIRTLE